ncbi:tetra-peptide repeat homeobox protein 1-like [Penaeus indicus]|uniref:tetra-peptide repeat homeobox protein 1-like n=1 Tax=Penaeus indicus TaxID=29960 RepID=UPI00300CADCF
MPALRLLAQKATCRHERSTAGVRPSRGAAAGFFGGKRVAGRTVRGGVGGRLQGVASFISQSTIPIPVPSTVTIHNPSTIPVPTPSTIPIPIPVPSTVTIHNPSTIPVPVPIPSTILDGVGVARNDDS